MSGEDEGRENEGRELHRVHDRLHVKAHFEHEVNELRRMRDELRLKVHLGRVEAKDHWERLEERFAALEPHARRVADGSGALLDDVGKSIARSLVELREGYADLRSTLSMPIARRDRFRQKIRPLVEGARTATGHVRRSALELHANARLRLERGRLDRELRKLLTELGRRVSELSDPDGTPPPDLDDASTGALLRDIKALEGQLLRNRAGASTRDPA